MENGKLEEDGEMPVLFWRRLYLGFLCSSERVAT